MLDGKARDPRPPHRGRGAAVAWAFIAPALLFYSDLRPHPDRHDGLLFAAALERHRRRAVSRASPNYLDGADRAGSAAGDRQRLPARRSISPCMPGGHRPRRRAGASASISAAPSAPRRAPSCSSRRSSRWSRPASPGAGCWPPTASSTRLLQRDWASGAWTRGWLGDFDFALPAVGIIGAWVLLGLCTMLLVTGIAKIDPTLYEAAKLDGASGPGTSSSTITLPGLRQEIGVCITVTVIAALASFDIVYIATGGGPVGHANCAGARDLPPRLRAPAGGARLGAGHRSRWSW